MCKKKENIPKQLYETKKNFYPKKEYVNKNNPKKDTGKTIIPKNRNFYPKKGMCKKKKGKC